MRQIRVNEPDINLKYVYFYITLIDGSTPAIDKDRDQPEVNINGAGWTSAFIGLLENMGFGNYRAQLTDSAISTVDSIILSHYKSTNTKDSFGEPIQVVAAIAQIPIFESEGRFNNRNIIYLTYATLPEAEQYLSTILNVDAWESAPQKDKLKSLMMATRDIDRLRFFGAKLNRHQSLEFPRRKNRYRNDYFSELTIGPNIDDDEHDRVIYDPYNNRPNGTCSYIDPRLPADIKILDSDSDDDDDELKYYPLIGQIPNDIKIACCEIALKYLEGVDIEEEMASLIYESQRYAGVGERVNRISTIEAYRAGINSQKAWHYLKPYLDDPYELRLTRI